jgi:hypothetical protein
MVKMKRWDQIKLLDSITSRKVFVIRHSEQSMKSWEIGVETSSEFVHCAVCVESQTRSLSRFFEMNQGSSCRKEIDSHHPPKDNIGKCTIMDGGPNNRSQSSDLQLGARTPNVWASAFAFPGPD